MIITNTRENLKEKNLDKINSNWEIKNLLLDKTLNKTLNKNSKIIKIYNLYTSESKNWNKFWSELKKEFDFKYEKQWNSLAILYSDFSEKISSNYIVDIEDINFSNEINSNLNVYINKSFFNQTPDSLAAQNLYCSYVNFFDYLIKNSLKNKKLTEELLLVFKSNYEVNNIINNWSLYELLVYTLVNFDDYSLQEDIFEKLKDFWSEKYSKSTISKNISKFNKFKNIYSENIFSDDEIQILKTWAEKQLKKINISLTEYEEN